MPLEQYDRQLLGCLGSTLFDSLYPQVGPCPWSDLWDDLWVEGGKESPIMFLKYDLSSIFETPEDRWYP